MTSNKKTPEKQLIIDKALKSLNRKKTTDSEVRKRFLEEFYRQVPSEDLVSRSASELVAVMSGLYKLGTKHGKGVHELRVFNPSEKENGWETHNTIIEIVNDDRPFLIDSIAAELSHQDLYIDVLFHPILKVKRKDDGSLSSILRSDDFREECDVESYIHIQLEQMLSKEDRERLKEDLNKVVKAVEYATDDWSTMMGRLDSAMFEMAYLPTSLDINVMNEARSFLKYVHGNNFTFLGYRRDKFETINGKIVSTVEKETVLGILKGSEELKFGTGVDTPEIQALDREEGPVMVSKLIEHYARVHRRVPLDGISVKIFNKEGEMVGQHFFVGLFTSSTYSCRTVDVPIVRRKVMDALERMKFGHDSHDRKALEHILEKYPRDELFQVSIDELVETSYGILRLQERHRVALFTRRDPLGRHISCLLYIPRDRFDSRLRLRVQDILEHRLNGVCTNFYTTLDDSPLARILFTVAIDSDKIYEYDRAEIEKEIIEIARAWSERLKNSLIEEFDIVKGMSLSHRYERAFSTGYQDQFKTNSAVRDIVHLEKIRKGDKIVVDLYQLNDASSNNLRLKVYHNATPVPLSNILPILSNMGLVSIAELPFEITLVNSDEPIWIHDFEVELTEGLNINIQDIKENFEAAFLQTWFGNSENDGLNELVIRAGLTWCEVNILRCYTGFLKQAKYPFSRRYIEQTLANYSEITAEIVQLFMLMHNPEKQDSKTETRIKKSQKKIDKQLQSVSQLDHDCILRSFRTVVERTLRTNYFQREENGDMKPWLSMKMDSQNIQELPEPRPHVEIYVYSTRLEAVHLRGGKIARGGLRWSDRHDDFRTEILGLMKSQMVKNAVIVPVGSKGGFIVKQPPKTGGRDAFFAEGIACYRLFIQALLDLTDNNIQGKIIRPKQIICRDDVDPYLVVAADKGTATFSDYANELSIKAGFWMGDAFASGGSVGYDHKIMGITARGAWESTKRHFRELGKNIQKEEFTVIGVGDMGGDVFGNGMLLSKHILLTAAFNHLHIFCDPNPDAASSYKERKRLFKAVSGWDKYNTELLSKGGCIYERSAKKLKLTKQIKERFGLDKTEVTPNELIRAMLVSNTDLLWFGGIGTYIKSSKESQADADDKNNDALRVNGRHLNAKVIGEGANLGVTQLGRIEFAIHGGKCNTDFIDNSAGVDCSDHEVNIKILMSDIMATGKMTMEERDKLLATMTDDVSSLVLHDNYQQTQAITFNLERGVELLPRYAALIRSLEKEGKLNRALEFLPDEEGIQRLLAERKTLSRPELSVLLAYAKIDFYQELLNSDIPDDSANIQWLYDYFPKALHGYKKQIENHKLKREIVATNIANRLVNRMGPAFVVTCMEQTGAKAEDVVKAFILMVQVFDIQIMWDDIEKLDNKVSVDIQMAAMAEVYNLVQWSVMWLLKKEDMTIDFAESVEHMQKAVQKISNSLNDVLPDYKKEKIKTRKADLIEQGMPEKMANRIAMLPVLVSGCDIIYISQGCSRDVLPIAKIYFDTGERLRFDWMRYHSAKIVPENHWEGRVLDSLVDELYMYQASVVGNIIQLLGCPTSIKHRYVDDWVETVQNRIKKLDQLVADIRLAPYVDLSMLILMGQQLNHLIEN